MSKDARSMDPENPDLTEADGVDRRRFLHLSGLSVGAATLLAACGNGGAPGEGEGEDDEEATPDPGDIEILRTASSLERSVIDMYERILASGVITDAARVEELELIVAQHTDHAQFLEGATRNRGAEAADEPNSQIRQEVETRLQNGQTPENMLQIAHDLEAMLTATYVSTVGELADSDLATTTMSVAGVEARHVALLAAELGQPLAPAAFQTSDGSVAPGTGL